MTPVVTEIIASPRFFGQALSARSELGLAFLLGLTAMIFIPTVLAAATWIRTNVEFIMQKLTGTTPPPPPPKEPPQ